MSVIIQFQNVSKAYRLGTGRESIREVVSRSFSRIRHRDKPATQNDILWAVKDVCFTLESGKTLGIIGTNGAGKTTMLKLLSRVTRPTKGAIKTTGRIASLIELGAGFHPDLTGRENVFLNGAIMGLDRKTIRNRYDSIVAFAELERFMETPVKRYSSGMYARLGFAVAAHLDADILLVDEVLSVGDINFQIKCYEFIKNYVGTGRSTVFVSHNLYAIEQLSQELIWLDHGIILGMGSAHEVLSSYMKAQDQKLFEIATSQQSEHSALNIARTYLTDAQGNEKIEFTEGDDLVVHLHYEALQAVQSPHFVVAVWDAATRQAVFLASMLADDTAPEKLVKTGEIVCHFSAPSLMPRVYQVWGEVWDAEAKGLLFLWQPLASFSIVDSTKPANQGSLRHTRADAPMRVSYMWQHRPD